MNLATYLDCVSNPANSQRDIAVLAQRFQHGDEGYNALVALLDHVDAYVRQNICLLLGLIPQRKAYYFRFIEVMCRMLLTDPDRIIQRMALGALLLDGSDSAMEALDSYANSGEAEKAIFDHAFTQLADVMKSQKVVLQ